ncbi:hypothetical protein [Streptomyces sp. NPDC046821]|uniref:hypothetical protein n=1 Tax=Streptomyces sp. NPDC046821 TaxID=3154702 RepID=UPI0033FC75F5
MTQALEYLRPLAEAGNGRAQEQFTELVISLARADSHYQPWAEDLLRAWAEVQGYEWLLRLAHEMRSWTGRETDAQRILIDLTKKQESREEALGELTAIDHDNPIAAVRWRCMAVESEVARHWGRSKSSEVWTQWARLKELLEDLPSDQEGRDLRRRALLAEYKAGSILRGPDPAAMDFGFDDAAALVGAAAAVPFVQTVATKAGGDVYDWVRQLFGRAVGRKSNELTARTEVALHIVGDSRTNTWLEMRGRPTDEALAKLAEADLETLAAPDPQGRIVIVYWAPEESQWRRRLEGSGER